MGMQKLVDEALIVLPQEQHFGKEYMEAFSEMGIVTHYSIMQDFADADNHQIAEKVCGYLVLTSGMQLVSNRQYLTKRVMDIAGGIAGSLITVILTIILGPLIYIKSPGPISSHRNVSERMVKCSRCTSSVRCIWMQRNGRKHLWSRTGWQMD